MLDQKRDDRLTRLVITRKEQEAVRIHVGDQYVDVIVNTIGLSRVKLRFDSPAHVRIHRAESVIEGSKHEGLLERTV